MSQKIMIIDDEPDIRLYLAAAAEDNGYEPLTADAEAPVVEMIASQHPDLVILDIMMPGLNGWGVLEIMKADPLLQHIPVIICTMVDDANRGYVLGATDFLRKPVDKDILRNCVQKYAEESHGRAPTALIVASVWRR